jgi:hypothetical protein
MRRASRRIPDEWNSGSRKIEGKSLSIDHDFDHVGVSRLGCSLEPSPECGHHERGIVEERAERLLDHRRLDERFITLNVDDEFVVEGSRHLRETIRSRPVAGGRHAHESAKSAHCIRNAVVIRSNNDAVQHLTGGRSPIDVLDEGLAGELGKRFSRETRRLVSSGDDSNRSVVR